MEEWEHVVSRLGEMRQGETRPARISTLALGIFSAVVATIPLEGRDR